MTTGSEIWENTMQEAMAAAASSNDEKAEELQQNLAQIESGDLEVEELEEESAWKTVKEEMMEDYMDLVEDGEIQNFDEEPLNEEDLEVEELAQPEYHHRVGCMSPEQIEAALGGDS